MLLMLLTIGGRGRLIARFLFYFNCRLCVWDTCIMCM